MNYHKNPILHLFLFFCFFLFSLNVNAQCNCSNKGYDDYCNDEVVILLQNGENITYDIQNAIVNSCRIRLANPSNGIHTYYTFPQVFRNIDHKEIILDAGVQLLGIQGGFSDCSQSVLTFDGEDVHDILIRGDYCEGQIKPLIGMVEANYTDQETQGYLVGADDVGNPYLNSIGQPNYIFADNDADPYFDNNGDPNFITNNQQMVQKECEYNDLLCNRKIVVWCPYSWEARHIISLHGVKNFWIQNLVIANASGGDGIHVTDDRDFNVSNEIHLDNLDFDQNARNGLKITNAYCVELTNLDFHKNGGLAPIDFVTPQAAFNIDQNTSPGSVDDYMGTLPDYALNNITFENGFFYYNVNRDMSFDIPLDLTLCNDKAAFKANNVCMSYSDDAVYFEQSNLLQEGSIKLHTFSITEFDNALVVTNDWLSNSLSLSIRNWTVTKSGTTQVNAFDINSNAFCNTLSILDICKSSNIADDICQPVECITPSYYCTTNQDPECPEDCQLDVYTNVEEVIDYNCECDYLFMVDESGSVNDEEFEEMNCSITNMMNELDSICMDSCDTRFALIEWAGTNTQNLTSLFDCLPFEFERFYPSGGTNTGDALEFLLNNLVKNEDFQPNDECLKVLFFTDASCNNFNNTNAGPIADVIKTLFPQIEFIVVDYTSTGQLEECEGVIDVIDDAEGEFDPDNIIQSEFDCESGIGIEDIADTSYTYTIHVEIDADCVFPTVIWTAYDGGEILSVTQDQATATVNGEGYYTVEVFCEYGCPGGMYQTVSFEDADLNNKVAPNQIAIVKKDRTRYHKGKAYSPHEFELLMLRDDEEEIEIEHIQVSPNPFVDLLHIDVPANDDNYDLKIFNTQGQLVHRSSLKSEKSIQVDLSDLANGLYVVRLLNTTTQNVVTHKVMKFKK